MNYDIHQGDCLEVMQSFEDNSIDCCVTSPPYWNLRDYGIKGQYGLEPTLEEYIENMVVVFREVRRILKDDGTLWLNLGDCYAKQGKPGGQSDDKKSDGWMPGYPTKTIPSGLKPKDLCMIPARVAMALQSDVWYLRSEIIWHKPNPMPESVTDRPTAAHEKLYLLSKSQKYYYDHDAIKQDLTGNPTYTGLNGRYQPVLKRNNRNVWTIPTQATSIPHFASYPEKLVEPCILAGCRVRGVVLDPFCGIGTTGIVAARLDRKFLGIDINPEYLQYARQRVSDADHNLFNLVEDKS